MIQRQTSCPLHFWDKSFAACDGVCTEDLSSDWRWKTPTVDLGTNVGLYLNDVVFLTSSKQIQHLVVRLGRHLADGVKQRHKSTKKFCILGQLDHGKAIDGFTVRGLGKRE